MSIIKSLRKGLHDTASKVRGAQAPSNMNGDDVEAPYRGFLDSLLTGAGFGADPFETSIADSDEMFWKAILPGYNGKKGLALWKYAESCLRMEHVYAQIVRHVHGGYQNIERVLDFGSGHGRLTRTLVHRLPADRIWVSDIYAHAIAWQAETFGVNAVVSVKDPARFALPLQFSVVFAGSVFSHLPEPLFKAWLSRLFRCVSDRGVLVFSVHDGALLPAGESLDRNGYRYLEFSESDSLGADIYGMTYVSEGWVRQCAQEVLADSGAAVLRFPKALYENQDLYIVGNKSSLKSSFELSIAPLTGFNSVSVMADGKLLCDGWAMDFTAGSLPQTIHAQAQDGTRIEGAVTGTNEEAKRFFPGARTVPIKWRVLVPSEVVRAGGDLHVTLTSSMGVPAHAYLSMDGANHAAHNFDGRAT